MAAPMTDQRPSAFARLRARLNRGDSWLTRDVRELFGAPRVIDAALADELEARLIAGDVGPAMAAHLVEALRRRAQGRALDARGVGAELAAEVVAALAPLARPLVPDAAPGPFVVLVVGVNGAGKTTTIAKLAERWSRAGRRVVLAAADTFRAAAVEQLAAWGERTGVAVVAQASGADPAAVAHDAWSHARSRGAGVLLVDTAGRLHSQGNLMDELRKVRRVLAKLDPAAPHEVLLVLDGSQGQNALAQAREFRKALAVSGLAITKLDGSARGGVLLAIGAETGLPIRAVGVGEGADDLQDFDAAAYAEALVGAPAAAGGAAA
jgi:fused signal recognition particle receptor